MKKIITSFSLRAAMILLATLLLTLTAQTARADDAVTLQQDGSEYYVNMLSSGTAILTLSDASITTFKVYDDGGKNSHYAYTGNSSLKITVPVGYLIRIEGTATTEDWGYDYWNIYNGHIYSDGKLFEWPSKCYSASINVQTTGNKAAIWFHKGKSSYSNDSRNLELTVTLIDVSKNLSYATITGIADTYPYSGNAININYSVIDIKGQTISSSNYTSVIKNSNNEVVSTVKDRGEYTLEITGKGDYSGSKSASFKVNNELQGQGTYENPYIIGSEDDWQTLAYNVSRGTTYGGKYVKLTADINAVTTMLGTSSNKFCGIFDGDGHTLSVSLGTSSNYLTEDVTAPFRYTDGATIKFLHVTGSIYTKNKFAAGLMGEANGNCTITSCQSSVTINSDRTGNSDKGGNHGGFIGVARGSSNTVNLTNCLFDGQLLGSNTNSCGGFVGWREGAMNINNCLFAPSATITISADNSATFTCNGSSNTNTTGSYYKTAFGDVQGTDASSMNKDDLQTALGSGWRVENNEVVPIMNSYNLASATITMTEFYKWDNGSAITVSYTVKDANNNELTKDTHFTAVIKNSSDQTVSSVTAIDTYTLTITGISPYSGSQTKTFEVSENLKENLSGFVFEKNDNGEYLIKTKADLNRLSAYTNADNDGNGKTFVQTGDIDFEPTDAWDKADSEENNFTAIGEFQGTYNGQGYTISGIRIHNSNGRQGLFSTSRGTVKNVKISNARIVANQIVGGIVGYGFAIITDCYVGNNVYISGTEGYTGGIVGYLGSSSGTVSGCVSMATVYGGTSDFAGGIVGMQNSNTQAVKDNLAIGVTVTGGKYSNLGARVEGAIMGRCLKSEMCQNNYYSNSQATCSETSEVKTSDIGVEFADVDGAREGFTVTINDASVSLAGSQDTYPTNDITTYSGNNVIKYGSTIYGAKGVIVKLSYSGNVSSGCHVAYTAVDGNSNAVTIGSNGEFTMPGSNVTVTGATVVPDGKEAVVINGGITHGTIVSDKVDGAVNGETVTLTVTPEEGYVMTSITVTNNEGSVSIAGPDAQFSTDLGGALYYAVNELTFTMGNSAATVDAVFGKIEELNFVNMPKDGDPKVVTVPADLTSFKVYDSGGKYSGYGKGENGDLVLTAPEGYVMNLKGSVKIRLYKDCEASAVLRIFDGNSSSSGMLGEYKHDQQHANDFYQYDETSTFSVDKTSSGHQILIHFETPSGSIYSYNDDFEFTVTLKKLQTNTEPVSYITATGTSDTKAAGTVYVLDGTEDELGTSGQTTWYIVPSTATGTNALSYKGRLKLNGDVHLILADGSKMTADGTDDPESGHFVALDAGNSGQLTIYGQANGTGVLDVITGNTMGISVSDHALTICGGTINVDAGTAFNGKSLVIYGGKFSAPKNNSANTVTNTTSNIIATNVQINGGEVTIGGYIQSGTGDVEINGGKVDVSGNIQSTSGDIILGWTNATDHIKATSYQTNTDQDHYVKIADGKVLKYTDGNTVKLLHTGIVLPSSISGKELTPYGIFGYCGKTDKNDGKNVYWSIALNDDPDTDDIEYSNTLVIEKNTNILDETNFDMANYSNDNASVPGNFAPWIKPNAAGNKSDGLKYPITAVTIADGVTSIGNEAFENCSGLQNVTIGNTVTSIGNQAFDHCSGLQIVTIGNSVTSIGNQAFDYCSGLQKVNIGNSVTTIGYCAFRECRGLQEVNIGSSVTTIDGHAFENCRELQNVTIPASGTTINGDAFRTCINLTVITMRPSTPPSLQNSDVFRDCDLKLILVPNEKAYTAYNGAGEGWDGKISENINTSPEDITYKSLLAPSVISLAKNTSGWGTYCHRYPVSYSLSEGATAYTLSGLYDDKTAVTIQEAAVTIEETDVNAVAPLTPLLLNYTAPDNDTETDDETVTLTALPATATTVSDDIIVSNGGIGWSYYGNATGTTQTHNPNSDPDDGIPALTGGWPTYILRNGTFVLVDTDEGIPAHRCVLSIGSSNAARVLTIGTGDETTGIEELKNGRIEELKWAGAWYSLDGRKLDKQPTKKGLYIYNGKKTVIK